MAVTLPTLEQGRYRLTVRQYSPCFVAGTLWLLNEGLAAKAIAREALFSRLAIEEWAEQEAQARGGTLCETEAN